MDVVAAMSKFPIFLSSLSLLCFSSSILSSPVVSVVVADWRLRAVCAAVTASIALSTLPSALRNASLASSRESQGHAANRAVRGRIEEYP